MTSNTNPKPITNVQMEMQVEVRNVRDWNNPKLTMVTHIQIKPNQPNYSENNFNLDHPARLAKQFGGIQYTFVCDECKDKQAQLHYVYEITYCVCNSKFANSTASWLKEQHESKQITRCIWLDDWFLLDSPTFDLMLAPRSLRLLDNETFEQWRTRQNSAMQFSSQNYANEAFDAMLHSIYEKFKQLAKPKE